MNKLFKWLDQIETIVYTIVECDAGDMSYDVRGIKPNV